MKAISLWQPWASLVVHGHKKIETRAWPAPKSVVGKRIAIHAAKLTRFDALLAQPPFAGLLDGELPHGAIVGTVRLTRCIKMTPYNIVDFAERRPLEVQLGDWQPGRWAWVLRDPRPLSEPVPWRGLQGFFSIEADRLKGTIRA